MCTTIQTLSSLVALALFLTAGGAASAAAKDTEATAIGKRVVAREDFDVPSRLLPPKILGRSFWNMLPLSATKAMEKHISQEPMVRDAAMCYWFPDLLAAGGDRLAVNADKLLEAQARSACALRGLHVRGTAAVSGMDDFRVDKKVYEKWKQQHPNFVGFWTGVEWDNEYVTR